MNLFRRKSRGANAVAILGMHRSGTSCLAGSLEELGLHLGAVQEQSPYNPKGNCEDREIRNLNEAILILSGGNWQRPPDTELVWEDTQLKARKMLIDRHSTARNRLWGFKDPRTLLTLPFWQAALPAMRTVGTYRHPLLVARSLNARGGTPIDVGLQLWKVYNQPLEALAAANRCPLISFDAAPHEYARSLRRIAAGLGLATDRAIDSPGFADDSLKKQSLNDHDQSIPDDVMALYRGLNQLCEQQIAAAGKV